MKKNPLSEQGIKQNYQGLNPIKLDKVDKKILNILQENNLITNQALAEKVNISAPPCFRRVKRLRELGVIAKDVSLLNPLKVSQDLVIFVSVTLEKQREDMLSYFERNMLEAPEVTQCYFISGDIDYLLVVQVQDMNQFHDFCRRVFVKEANIELFRSSFCLSRVKYDTKIYLSEE